MNEWNQPKVGSPEEDPINYDSYDQCIQKKVVKGGFHVRCPKCSAEMAEGFIDNAKCPVFWKKLGYQDNFITWYSKKRPGRIQLGDGDFLTGGRVSAFYCSVCNLVLITDIRRQ